MQTVLHFALSNAVLAAVPAVLAMAAWRWSRRPALVHALWVLALVKLVTPPVVGVDVPVLKQERVVAAAAGGPVEASPAFEEGEWLSEPGLHPGPLTAYRERDTESYPWADVPWTRVLVAAWVVGSASVLLVTVGRVRRFNRVLRDATEADRATVAHVKDVAGRLGLAGAPAASMLRGAVSPMLWAVGGRARLLIPSELWGKLSYGQRTSLLAHELAHWRRRDHWVRWLELAVSILYWWHPLVWVARAKLREAEEQCCDAWVVWAMPDARRQYAEALVETVDFIGGSDPTPALASGAGQFKGLVQRVRSIMSEQKERSMGRGNAAVVMALGMLLLPCVPRLAAADDEKADAPVVKREGGEGKEVKRGGEGEKDREAIRKEGRPVEKEREARKDGDVIRKDGEKPRKDGDVAQKEAARDGGDAKPRKDGDARAATKGKPLLGRLHKVQDSSLHLRVGDAGREVIVPTNDKTAIVIDGARGKLGQLTEGAMVSVVQEDGVTTQVSVETRKSAKGRDGEARKDGDVPREKEARRDGDAPREKDARRDGDAPREKEGRKDGDAPREKEGRKDGDAPREKEARRDGDDARGELEALRKEREALRREAAALREQEMHKGQAARKEATVDRDAAIRKELDARRERELRIRNEGEVRRDVESIRKDSDARPRSVGGRVLKAGDDVLVLDAVKEAEAGRIELRVNARTKVYVDGRPAHYDDLKTGMPITVSAVGRYAAKIEAGGAGRE